MSTKVLKRAESRKRFGPGITAEEIERGFGSALQGNIVLMREMPNGDKVGGGAVTLIVINEAEGFYRTANVYLPEGPLGGHFGKNYKATGSYVVPLPAKASEREALLEKFLDKKSMKGKPYSRTKRTFNGLVERVEGSKKRAPRKAATEVAETVEA